MCEDKCAINVADQMFQFYFCGTSICPIKPPVELSTTVGKIRAVVPTGYFKDDLLLKMSQVADLLKKGFITEALVILSTIIEKVTHKMQTRKFNHTGLNLLIGDLLRLKQAILDELHKCVVHGPCVEIQEEKACEPLPE